MSTVAHVTSDVSGRLHAGSARAAWAINGARARAGQQSTDMCAQVNVQAPAGTGKSEGGINKIEKLPTKDEKEEKPSKDEMPEFMTAAMREKISRTVLRKEHEEKVKSMLEASETACDDTHKFITMMQRVCHHA